MCHFAIFRSDTDRRVTCTVDQPPVNHGQESAPRPLIRPHRWSLGRGPGRDDPLRRQPARPRNGHPLRGVPLVIDPSGGAGVEPRRAPPRRRWYQLRQRSRAAVRNAAEGRWVLIYGIAPVIVVGVLVKQFPQSFHASQCWFHLYACQLFISIYCIFFLCTSHLYLFYYRLATHRTNNYALYCEKKTQCSSPCWARHLCSPSIWRSSSLIGTW